jgi:signal transduction histidine kinase
LNVSILTDKTGATRRRADFDQPGRECDQILARGGEVLVTVDADADADAVQVSVRDQGIGMSPRDMGQLFEKFYRVGSVFRFTLPTSDELAGSGR